MVGQEKEPARRRDLRGPLRLGVRVGNAFGRRLPLGRGNSWRGPEGNMSMSMSMSKTNGDADQMELEDEAKLQVFCACPCVHRLRASCLHACTSLGRACDVVAG